MYIPCFFVQKSVLNKNSNLGVKISIKTLFWENKNLYKCVFYFFADGKFHVVPSGDLHILRANLPADAATPYACRVRNTLTGREETSPPFNLIVDGKFRIHEPCL